MSNFEALTIAISPANLALYKRYSPSEVSELSCGVLCSTFPDTWVSLRRIADELVGMSSSASSDGSLESSIDSAPMIMAMRFQKVYGPEVGYIQFLNYPLWPVKGGQVPAVTDIRDARILAPLSPFGFLLKPHP